MSLVTSPVMSCDVMVQVYTQTNFYTNAHKQLGVLH